MSKLFFEGQLDIYSISSNTRLRSCGKEGDLSQLGNDEYFSFSLYVQNIGYEDFVWEHAYVSVDNGPAWHWCEGQLPASCRTTFHIWHCNMQTCMTPGTHTAVWYFDGRPVHRETFRITQQWRWESVFPIPSRQEIAQYRNVRNLRSPYVSGWFFLPKKARYTDYTVEFKADHIPKGTYWCLGQWALDLSGLKKRYHSVKMEANHVSGYAGFQRIADGRMVSIMSLWDIYCQDALGNQTTIRAKRLYPQEVIDGGRFWGEGDGARSTAPFAWKSKRWYRMHLRCIPSPDHTVMEQWVCDLETEEYTLLCRYEVAVPNAVMEGDVAIFLENFLPETAGEVRTMEVRNVQYLDADTRQWHRASQVHLSSWDGLPHYEGSYHFGVTDGRIWMITSGVGGDWFYNGKGKAAEVFLL